MLGSCLALCFLKATEHLQCCMRGLLLSMMGLSLLQSQMNSQTHLSVTGTHPAKRFQDRRDGIVSVIYVPRVVHMVHNIQQQLQGLLVCIALGIFGSSKRQWQRLQPISIVSSPPCKMRVSCDCAPSRTMMWAVQSIVRQLHCVRMIPSGTSALPQLEVEIPEDTSSAYVSLQSKARQSNERQMHTWLT